MQAISETLLQIPRGGKEVRLHFCLLKNALSRAFAITRGHLYFLSFLSFFSHFIIFVIIREYFISNTARRPIDMVVQTNSNPIHNQEKLFQALLNFVLFAAFQIQNH